MFISKIISTFFYIGLIPFAPGTFGTLAAFFLSHFVYYVCDFDLSRRIFLFLAILSGIIGTISSEIYSRAIKVSDPKQIVIDEVCGYFLALFMAMFFLKNNQNFLIISVFSFVLFRFFDILKPFPISYFDKNLHGGIGIMFDDVLAGIFAGIVSFLLMNKIN